MKPMLRLFLISFFAALMSIMWNCHGGSNSGHSNDPSQDDEAFSSTGSDVTGSTKEIWLSVKGMTCHACVNTLEALLKSEDGVKDAEAFLDGRVRVSYDSKKITVSDIKKVINGIFTVE